MIKVNLLKSRAVAGEVKNLGGAGGVSPNSAESVAQSFELDEGFNTFEYSQMGQLLKLALVVGFVVPLIVFEKLRDDKSSVEISAKQAEVQAIQENKFEKEEAVKQYEDSQKKRDILVLRNKELQRVKVERLLAVKTVDAIQTAIPEDVWLTSLTLDQRFIRINGNTLMDTGLDEFVRNLKKVHGFLDVNVPKDIKRKDESGRVLNEFLVTLNITEGIESKGSEL